MKYLALYRKWRPLIFEDVVGQEHIVRTLKNEITSGRLSHAYIFSGTRGTGKTSTAKILSRAINCTNPQNGNPCNECESCKGIISGTLLDVIEMDAASNNGVDDIRVIRDEAVFAPADLKYKVYIIDEVHMLSTSAFNALLKTLEEPPPHVVFILATTEAHKIPVTILSRCQRFDFKKISADHIKSRLNAVIKGEELNIDDDALSLVARLADGSLRDALSLLDQCTVSGKNHITLSDIEDMAGVTDNSALFTLSTCIANKDLSGALSSLSDVIMQGRDIKRLTEDIITHFRNLLICSVCKNPEKIMDSSEEAVAPFKNESSSFKADEIINIIKTFSASLAEQKTAISKRTSLEVAVIKLCSTDIDFSAEALAARISALESALKSGKALSAGASFKEEAPKAPSFKEAALKQAEPLKEEEIAPAPASLEIAEEKPSAPEETEQNKEEKPAAIDFSSIFKQVLAEVEKVNPMLSGFLSLAEPSLSGSDLTIYFTDSISKKLAEENDGDVILNDICYNIAGEKFNIIFKEKEKDTTTFKEENENLSRLYKLQESFPEIIKFT